MLIKKINITLLIIIEYICIFGAKKIFYNDIFQLSIIIN